MRGGAAATGKTFTPAAPSFSSAARRARGARPAGLRPGSWPSPGAACTVNIKPVSGRQGGEKQHPHARDRLLGRRLGRQRARRRRRHALAQRRRRLERRAGQERNEKQGGWADAQRKGGGEKKTTRTHRLATLGLGVSSSGRRRSAASAAFFCAFSVGGATRDASTGLAAATGRPGG